MNKILAGILSFLLCLMPWFPGLSDLIDHYAFDEYVLWNKVAVCVETNDIATLESLMHPWLKDNTSDLSGEIQRLLDSIDGDVLKVDLSGGEYRSGNIVYRYLIIYTTGILHNLRVDYTTTIGKSGISRMTLSTGQLNSPEYTVLAEIRVL